MYQQWLATGDGNVRQQWREALKEFGSAKNDHLAAYENDLDYPAWNFFAVDRGLKHATRNEAMTWLARALLVVAAALLVLGSGPIARRMPEWPGKTGARALWTSLLLPWRPPDLPALRRSDWLVGAVGPMLWLFLALATFSSFASGFYLGLMAVVLGGFGVVVVGLGKGDRFRRMVALAAPLLAVVWVLVWVMAVRGPGLFWFRFWTDGGFRVAFTVIQVITLVWLMFVVYATQRAAAGGGFRTVGLLLAASGVVVVGVGAVPAVLGLETMLTALNDQMAVIPLGLSRILGITTHLDIPAALPVYLLGIGGGLVMVGLVMAQIGKGLPSDRMART